MKIEGITPKMVDSLSRKWKRPETVTVNKDVDIPDPDPEAKKGATVKDVQRVTIPNPQSKEAFVGEKITDWIKNEYRLQEREDDKKTVEKTTDARIEKEVALKVTH